MSNQKVCDCGRIYRNMDQVLACQKADHNYRESPSAPDLVARLRDFDPGDDQLGLREEAAAEIERLRQKDSDDIKRAIERNTAYERDADANLAEIERLTRERDEAKAWARRFEPCGCYEAQRSTCRGIIERGEARPMNCAEAHPEYDERDRLRAALVRYGRHDFSGMADQPESRCTATRLGGGPCTCGFDEARRGAGEKL